MAPATLRPEQHETTGVNGLQRHVTGKGDPRLPDQTQTPQSTLKHIQYLPLEDRHVFANSASGPVQGEDLLTRERHLSKLTSTQTQDHPLGGGNANVSTALRPAQGSELRKRQNMGRSVSNGTGNVSERSRSNATRKSQTPTAPNTGLTCKLIMEYLQGKIQGKTHTFKQADDGVKFDYFNAHNTTCTTLGPAQGAEHKCLPEPVIRDSHSPCRRAQALRPDPTADSGTGRFEVSASSTTLGALGCISIDVRGMHNCAEFKEPPASPKATLAPEEQLNICEVVLGFGLYPGDALLGLGVYPGDALLGLGAHLDASFLRMKSQSRSMRQLTSICPRHR